jgi:hypothetical protein
MIQVRRRFLRYTAKIAIDLARVAAGLRLNDLGCLIGDPHGYLGKPAAALERMTQSVARDVRLHHDKVLERPAACKLVHGIEVFRHALLHNVEPLARDFLGACDQDIARL